MFEDWCFLHKFLLRSPVESPSFQIEGHFGIITGWVELTYFIFKPKSLTVKLYLCNDLLIIHKFYGDLHLSQPSLRKLWKSLRFSRRTLKWKFITTFLLTQKKKSCINKMLTEEEFPIFLLKGLNYLERN